MEPIIKDYLDKYEDRLTQHLQQMLLSMQCINGKMPDSPDINDVWQKVAPTYVADGVKEITKYPTVALGWAMYLGMGVAYFWDKDWQKYSQVENLYEYLRDKRGFDYMDEVVRGEILGLQGEEFDRMETIVQDCAHQTLSMLRHEQIEPQSPMAFHIYARSIRVLYKMGAAVQLCRMGYKMQKM